MRVEYDEAKISDMLLQHIRERPDMVFHANKWSKESLITLSQLITTRYPLKKLKITADIGVISLSNDCDIAKKMSQYLKDCCKLELLDLSDAGLSVADADIFIEMLYHNSYVSELVLVNDGCSYEGGSHIPVELSFLHFRNKLISEHPDHADYIRWVAAYLFLESFAINKNLEMPPLNKQQQEVLCALGFDSTTWQEESVIRKRKRLEDIEGYHENRYFYRELIRESIQPLLSFTATGVIAQMSALNTFFNVGTVDPGETKVAAQINPK